MTEPNVTEPAEPTAAVPVVEPTPPVADAVAGETVTVPDGATVTPGEIIATDGTLDEDTELVVVEFEFVTVLITPAEGQPLEGLARTLIDLAEHPHHVEWRPRQGAFEVPAALAQAYAQAVTPAPEDGKKKPAAARKGSRSTTKAKKEGGNG